MNADDRKLVQLIREAMPPLSDPSCPTDLWPRFERRLDDRQIRVGRVDWFMAGLVLALLAGFPETVLLLLYHL